MANTLKDGAEWLARKQRKYTASRVRYLRGTSSLFLQAMRGRSVFEVTDANGFSTRVEAQDYIIFVDDLRLDGVPTTPQSRDQIIDGDLTFEAMDVGSEPCFRYADENRYQFRIHTKKVAETT